MPRGRPGTTPRVKETGEKQAPRPIKGNHGNGGLVAPGPGRPKGSRNKFSGNLEQMILDAMANAVDNDDALGYLIQQAKQANPSPFMSLVGRCIAQKMQGDNKVDLTVKVEFID